VNFNLHIATQDEAWHQRPTIYRPTLAEIEEARRRMKTERQTAAGQSEFQQADWLSHLVDCVKDWFKFAVSEICL